jgi:cytochrome P450
MSSDTTTFSLDAALAAYGEHIGYGSTYDPYPDWERRLAEAPVQPCDFFVDIFGQESAPDPLPPGLPQCYMVLGHERVTEVLADTAHFSNRGYADNLGAAWGYNIIGMDPPEHERYRELLQHAFTKRALSAWEDTLIVPVVDRLLDEVADLDTVDLMRAFTWQFPSRVIAGLIGLDETGVGIEEFQRLSIELIAITMDPALAIAASTRLRQLFQTTIEARRRAPTDDLVSMLLAAQIEGERLTDEEIQSFMLLLLPAGIETTYRSSSSLLLALLKERSWWDELRSDVALLPAAIEEGLRWEAPIPMLVRLSLQESEVGGVRVPAGAMVGVNLGSANHDPSRWNDPHRFDPRRERRAHVSFATGPHTCLGLQLARLETRIAVERLMARLPDISLDTSGEDVVVRGRRFRSPRTLPVHCHGA